MLDVNRLLLMTVDAISALGMTVEFKWVPSAWNIADAPSRNEPIDGIRRLGCDRSVTKLSVSCPRAKRVPEKRHECVGIVILAAITVPFHPVACVN